MMPQETERYLIALTISSFNQEGLHLGAKAEAFLISNVNALIDSPDDKMSSLIIDLSKVIFGSLGIAWCTSKNLQSGQSGSFSWKRWFAKQAFTLAGNVSIEMVKAWISANFCERLLCCICQALSTDSSHLSTLKILRQIIGVGISRSPTCKAKNKSNRSI